MADFESETTIKPEFERDLKALAEEIARADDFLVVGHHDADGITATAIAVDFLKFLSKRVEYINIKQLDSVSAKKIREYASKTLLFVDFGSGQLKLLDENNITNFFIVDHHNPQGEHERQINPHFYGYDGGSDVSGAGMAYLVARAMGCKRMAHIAVVGAVGDMQDSDGRMSSLNRLIMREAIAQGTLKVKNDLSLFGRQSRMLPQMLAYATDPVVPYLTGNPQACAEFIQAQGISLDNDDLSPKTYVDLSWDERQKLSSALYMRLVDFNTPEFVIHRMFGEVYTLLAEERKTELRDAKEFSTLLNACGRHDASEIGVRVCLGDRGESLMHAKRLLEKHRRELREGIDYLTQKGVEKMGSFYFFDSEGAIKESIIGVIAGMAYGARIIPPDKPVLAFATDRDDPGFLKVSSRANWGLVRAGIHLGNAMDECSSAVGGEGGGHDIAAGARIPKEKKQEFLALIDETLRKQRGK